MKILTLALLLSSAVGPQTLAAQSDTASASANDPYQLLNNAAQYYDYASADMKPWHVRYHYKKYDQSGQALGEGNFEYWWSTPKGSKASWTRGNQTITEWHNADGKRLRSGTGYSADDIEGYLSHALQPGFVKIKDPAPGNQPLKFFKTVVSSLPVDCAGVPQLSRYGVRPSTSKVGESVLSIGPATNDAKIDSLDSASPGYCFEEHAPVFIASHNNGTITLLYGQNRKFQNHNFAGEITISYVGVKRVVATLEDLTEVPADDPSFTPSPDAQEYVPQTRQISIPVRH